MSQMHHEEQVVPHVMLLCHVHGFEALRDVALLKCLIDVILVDATDKATPNLVLLLLFGILA